MPLDMLITGRIATLAGDDGLRLGRGDRDPRRAGRLRRLRGRARDARRPVHRADRPRARRGGDPGPDRRAPPPRRRRGRDPPGRPVRRRDARRRAGARSAPPTRALADPGRLARGSRLGRRPLGPLADRRRPRDASRPGRRCALWAHDHHALLASRAALDDGRRRRATRPIRPAASSGATRDGDAEGVLLEAATRLVTRHVPPIAGRPTSRPRSSRSRSRCWRSASSPSTTRAALVAGPRPGLVVPGLRAPVRDRPAAGPGAGLAARRRARHGARRRAAQRRDPRREPRRVVPGSAGRNASPTARSGRGRRRCWPTSSPSPTVRSRPSAGAASGSPSPSELRELVERAAAGGIATQIHAIGDAAVRAALDVLEPTAAHGPVHAQDRARPAARPGRSSDGSPRPASWPASSPSISAAMPRRPGGCGATGPRRSGYTWGSIAATGAVLAFGTDAPVEPFDPWPGIALAVRREDPPLAGRDARRSARRGAQPRARPARRLCRAATLRARARSRPADRRPARRHRGHPGGVARRAGRARRRPLDRAPVDRPRRRAGRLRGLAGPPVSPASGRLRRPRRRRRAPGARRRTAR